MRAHHTRTFVVDDLAGEAHKPAGQAPKWKADKYIAAFVHRLVLFPAAVAVYRNIVPAQAGSLLRLVQSEEPEHIGLPDRHILMALVAHVYMPLRKLVGEAAGMRLRTAGRWIAEERIVPPEERVGWC